MACEETIDTLIIMPNSSIAEFANPTTANSGLNVLIESLNGYTSGISGSFSQEANQHPSPYSRSHTSTVRTSNDILNISGTVHCIQCTGANAGDVDFGDYAARFKKLQEVQQYTVNELAEIATPVGYYRNMRLSDFSFELRGETTGIFFIDCTWEAMNVSGDMRNPAWASGGLVT